MYKVKFFEQWSWLSSKRRNFNFVYGYIWSKIKNEIKVLKQDSRFSESGHWQPRKFIKMFFCLQIISCSKAKAR